MHTSPLPSLLVLLLVLLVLVVLPPPPQPTTPIMPILVPSLPSLPSITLSALLALIPLPRLLTLLLLPRLGQYHPPLSYSPDPLLIVLLLPLSLSLSFSNNPSLIPNFTLTNLTTIITLSLHRQTSIRPRDSHHQLSEIPGNQRLTGTSLPPAPIPLRVVDTTVSQSLPSTNTTTP